MYTIKQTNKEINTIINLLSSIPEYDLKKKKKIKKKVFLRVSSKQYLRLMGILKEIAKNSKKIHCFIIFS